MAVKIVLFIVAVLFAGQECSAVPLERSDKMLRIGPEDIFLTIAGALQKIEEIIDDIENKVVDGVSTAVDAVQNATLAFQEQLENAVNKAIQEAEAVGKDVQNCTTEEEPRLKEALAQLQNKSVECILERAEKVSEAEQRVQAIQENFAQLRNDTEAAREECASKGNIVLRSICAVQRGPQLLVRAGGLLVKLQVSRGLVIAEVAQLLPLAGVCAGARVAEWAAQATQSVQAIQSCVAEKLQT